MCVYVLIILYVVWRYVCAVVFILVVFFYCMVFFVDYSCVCGCCSVECEGLFSIVYMWVFLEFFGGGGLLFSLF